MRLLIASLLILFSSLASASYTWRNGIESTEYPSATAACSGFQKVVNDGYTEADAEYVTILSVSAASAPFYCEYQRLKQNNSSPSKRNLIRDGSSCDAGTTYDETTGECKSSNKCDALKGQSVAFSKSGTAPDGYMSLSGKISAPSQAACYSGCAVSTVDQKCTTKVKGSYFCRGTAVYSGEECPSGTVTPTVDTSSTAAYPDAQTTNTSEPCVYKSDGKGGYTCSSSTGTESEGQNCGTVNGKTVCVDKLPTSQTNKIDTQVNTTANSDGSSTTNKTDTSTVTTCSGINSCTSTSTTTNTTVNKDASGNKTSETSSSTGSGSTNGVAKDSSGEGESEEGTSADAGLPTVPNYIEKGGYSDAKADYDDTATKFWDKVSQAPVVTAIKGFKLEGSGSCPTLSADTYLGSFSMTDFCSSMTDILGSLGTIMLLFWAIVAVRVAASA